MNPWQGGLYPCIVVFLRFLWVCHHRISILSQVQQLRWILMDNGLNLLVIDYIILVDWMCTVFQISLNGWMLILTKWKAFCSNHLVRNSKPARSMFLLHAWFSQNCIIWKDLVFFSCYPELLQTCWS